MPDAPQISVIVPVYNRRELICRAVRSLLDQEVQVPYEIVVVDDGSTDGSGDAVRGLDARVRVIHQHNQGAPEARHSGIRAARSNLVAFLDSDDLATPNKLSSLHAALKAHPGCILSFGVTKAPAKPNGDAHRWIKGSLDGRTVVIEEPFRVILGTSAPFAGAMNLMTYREPALECSAGRSFYRSAEDYDFQVRMAAQGRFVFTAAVTALYDIQPDGVTGTYGTMRQEALALHSALEAFRCSPERARLRELIKRRVEVDGPRIAVGLAMMRDWRMLSQILPLIARHGRWTRVPRGFWWAFDRLLEERPAEIPRWLAWSVVLGRVIRSRRNRGGPSYLGEA